MRQKREWLEWETKIAAKRSIGVNFAVAKPVELQFGYPQIVFLYAYLRHFELSFDRARWEGLEEWRDYCRAVSLLDGVVEEAW